MALADNALGTLAKMKARLKITSGVYDSLLEAAITAATSIIEGYCHRTFVASNSIVEKVRAYGTTEITVKRPPIVGNPISIVDRSGAVVDPTSYEIDGDDAAEGGWITNESGWVASSLMLPPNTAQDPLPGHERAAYTVTYKGGYVCPNQNPATFPTHALLPASIEEACYIAAFFLYASNARDPIVRGEMLMSYNVQYGAMSTTIGASGLPLNVEAMLNPDVLPGQAG